MVMEVTVGTMVEVMVMEETVGTMVEMMVIIEVMAGEMGVMVVIMEVATRFPSSAPAGIPPPPPDTCTTPIVNRANICSAFQQVSTLFDAALSNPNIALPSEIFASAVRVVFHDAGEVDVRSPNDLLGSDGCLSSDFNNEGLVIPTAVVQRIFEPMYREVCDRISRADFWVLLGKLTLDRAITPALPVPFHYGRVDNNECEAGNRRLPSAEGDLTEISRVFVDQMGLTMDDAGIYYIVCILHYIIYSVYITLYFMHYIALFIMIITIYTVCIYYIVQYINIFLFLL